MEKQRSRRAGRRKFRRVCLLVHTANEWSRQILRGVANYAHEHGMWDFHIEPRGFYEHLRLPREWSGDGIITRLTHPGLAGAIRRTGIPAVNVSWLGKHSDAVSKVVSDEAACGRLGAEHFLEKGFRSFGYVGPTAELGYSDVVGREFAETVGEDGYACAVTKPHIAENETELRQRRRQIARWLRRLDLPVGILVWSSETGRELTTICAELGLSVPEELAVLCVEHDPLMSALAPVPLSNVDQAPTRVGYEAAALLERLMRGGTAPDEPVLIPPIGIVQRQSTDTTAVDDPLVSQAMEFIRDHASEPIQVIDLQKLFDVSRRMLEHHFVRVLGRTPAAEIRRARLERTKRLLVETDLPVSKIAYQAGFNHPEVLIRTFQRELGLTPSEYRRSR